MPPPRNKMAQPPEAMLAKIREFLAKCEGPAAIEPGELPYVLDEGHFELRHVPQGVLIEAWDADRNLARRLVRIVGTAAHRLEVETLRFGGKAGRLTFVDLNHGRGADSLRQASRDVLRERLRVMAARQFPGWQAADVTSGADLQHSLSPVFARGVMKRGEFRWAVLAAPDSPAAEAALTYGLIWLDYLRQRELPREVEGLALFVPPSEVATTRIRLACLHRRGTRFRLFSYDESGNERAEDVHDVGNVDTSVVPAMEPCLAAAASLPAWVRQLAELPEVEAIASGESSWSLRVRGLEFASVRQGEVWCGLERPARVRSAAPVEDLAAKLAAIRSVDSADREHVWRRARPEAWLESMVRQNLGVVDPALNPAHVYGQVPNLGGRDRGIVDLLAIDNRGRLCVIELKATEDPGLPMQALDYWWRVARHLERGDFQSRGYFAGSAIRNEPPRLFLVAPALSFHPTTETILAAFAPSVEVERVGLGVEWQSRPKVVLRLRGARRPEWSPASS